jgi:hypothetical protein
MIDFHLLTSSQLVMCEMIQDLDDSQLARLKKFCLDLGLDNDRRFEHEAEGVLH